MNPRLGIFVLPVVASECVREAQNALQTAIGDVILAERLGFDSAWIAEHHGTGYGGVCPSGMLFLAHLAACTNRIGLGTAVSVVPLHDPVRLTEESLLVDHLSRGRLEIGVGRGFLAVDFATLGVEMARRHELFERGVSILRQGLESNVGLDDAQRLYPSRFRTGRIPLWGAAATSRESVTYFAKAGMGLMLNPYTRSVDEVAEAIGLYRECFFRSRGADEEPRVLIHEHLFVSSSAGHAFDAPRPYLMAYLNTLRQASSIAGDRARTEHSTGPERYEDICPRRVAFGTPAQIRERIARWMEAGVTDFAFSVRFGGMPDDLVHDSLRLFSMEVMESHTPALASA